MPDSAAVKLIADNLAALVHPGDGKPIAIPLPMFRNSGIPADQADQFAKDAGLPHADINTLVAECIVHLLTTNGLPPTSQAELEQLQRAAAANDHHRHLEVRMHCTCNAELFTAAVTDFQTDRATISPQVIRAMQQLSPECALAHQVVA